MRVKVLFFGMLKDIVGRAEDHIEVADDARVESVFTRYARDFPRLTDLESSIVLACNHEFCDRSAAVREGDEIAFLPPVSGGLDVYTHEIIDAHGNFYGLWRVVALPLDSINLGQVQESIGLHAWQGRLRSDLNLLSKRFLSAGVVVLVDRQLSGLA